MSARIRARLVVLLGIILLSSWQVYRTRLQLQRGASLPPLLEQQIIDRNGLRVNDCERAILRANQPYGEAVNPNRVTEPNLMDAEAARLLLDRALSDYLGLYGGVESAVVGTPLLLRVDIQTEKRLVWGRVWVLPNFDGIYDGQSAYVMYLDAIAGVPLALFTDIEILQLDTSPSCLVPLDATAQQKQQLTNGSAFLIVASLAFILIGLIWEIRQQING